MPKKEKYNKIPKWLLSLIITLVIVIISFIITILLYDQTVEKANLKIETDNLVFFVTGSTAVFLIVFLILSREVRRYVALLTIVILTGLTVLVVSYNSTKSFLDKSSDPMPKGDGHFSDITQKAPEINKIEERDNYKALSPIESRQAYVDSRYRINPDTLKIITHEYRVTEKAVYVELSAKTDKLIDEINDSIVTNDTFPVTINFINLPDHGLIIDTIGVSKVKNENYIKFEINNESKNDSTLQHYFPIIENGQFFVNHFDTLETTNDSILNHKVLLNSILYDSLFVIKVIGLSDSLKADTLKKNLYSWYYNEVQKIDSISKNE